MTIDEVVGELRDGMTIGIGGWGSRRKPMALIRAMLRSDVKDLTLRLFRDLLGEAEFADEPRVRHRTFAWDRVDGEEGAARAEFGPRGYVVEENYALTAAAQDIHRTGELPALAVCHGGSIRVMLCRRDPRGLDAFHEFKVPNVAVVAL